MMTALFPDLPVRRDGFFQLDALHTMYWEESGNPAGVPVLVLHGGPGGGASPLLRRFFDPDHYRIIQFDQRGCGRSTPHAETRDNTTAHLIQDIEYLRQFLGINAWLIWGGSWGATLGLAYGQRYPDNCLGFILRSPFTFSQNEIDWFLFGGRYFHPELWAEFVSFISPTERGNLLHAYHSRLNSPDGEVQAAAARHWTHYEMRRSSLLGQLSDTPPDFDLCLARLECHYLVNQGFIDAKSLMQNVSTLAHLPCAIVQGRYDMICPPQVSVELAARWTGSRLHLIPDAGHTAFEEGTKAALLNAAVDFHTHRKFPV